MTHNEAIQFARSSAAMAFDQAIDYGGLSFAIQSFRDNIRDTLFDEGAADLEPAAFEAFDAEVMRLRTA